MSVRAMPDRLIAAAPDRDALTELPTVSSTIRSPDRDELRIFTRSIFIWLRRVFDDRELSALAYRTAFFVSQDVDRRKGYAYPSQERLAERLGVSRRGVQLALVQLRDRGHITVEVTRGQGRSNRYRLVGNANGASH